MARTGWAYGHCIGSSEWLTIPGSAYTRPALVDAADQAVKPGYEDKNSPWVLANVREVFHPGVTLGCAYKIIGTA